ncbi:hypothetical protein LINPERHAP1_LOCUS15806 [Linum perenne]
MAEEDGCADRWPLVEHLPDSSVLFWIWGVPAEARRRRGERLQQDPPAGISAAPQDNSILLWNAVIFG